jgi:DNA modification methylase
MNDHAMPRHAMPGQTSPSHLGGHLLVRANVRRPLPFADGTFQCIVTSPPYYGLRDYGTSRWVGGEPECVHRNSRGGQVRQTMHPSAIEPSIIHGPNRGGGNVCIDCGAVRQDDQLGLEPTPAEYVRNMVEVFRECRRVLRDDGVFWLDIGDSFAGSWGNQGRKLNRGKQRPINGEMIQPVLDGRYPSHGSKTGSLDRIPGIKNKDLIGIPWMLAFALRDDGWHLRQEIIWAKRNSMPESVKDRPSRAHEQVFLLTKRPRYFYDTEAIREHGSDSKATQERRKYPLVVSGRYGDERLGNRKGSMGNGTDGARNARSVWSLSVGGYKGAHFAVMPSKLAARCILAGSSQAGCCPACGSPWRRVVEKRREATRPGNQTKVYVPNPEFKQDGTGNRRTIGFNARWKESQEIGNRDPERHTTTVRTVGWESTCTCREPRPVPCRIFDPFGGAGTTAKVATQLGRHGFATELSADYLTLAAARMATPEKHPITGLMPAPPAPPPPTHHLFAGLDDGE